MHRGFIATTALAAVVGLAACSSTVEANPPAHRSDVKYAPASLTQAAAVPDVVDRCVEMGLDVVAAAEENTVFSPLSWCMALGMLAPGTTNDGRVDLEAAVGTNVDTFVEALGAIAATVAEDDGEPAELEDLDECVVVHRASQVVVRRGMTPQAAYLDVLRKHFDAGLDEADLSTEEGFAPLHEFVQRHTGGRIQRSAMQPAEHLNLVLQDAIFFASPWYDDMRRLDEVPFTNSDGSTTEVPFIATTAMMQYAEVDGWRLGVVEMYGGYAAAFFLPPPEGTSLDAATRASLLDNLERHEVFFMAPVLNLKNSTNLLSWFGHFGMGSLLQGEGTLGGILEGQDNILIAQAAQQATLELDEEGVVATAVTEVGTEVTATPPEEPVVLRIDRPFTVAILHEDLGLDLFQATVRTMGE